MWAIFRKLEKYNKNGRLRAFLYYIEFLFLIISFPITYIFSSLFLGLNLKIDILEYSIFITTVIVSWYIKEKISSQAKLPRTQRYFYLIINNSQPFILITIIAFIFKLIFTFDNLPFLFIAFYLSFTFFVSLFFKLLAFRILKIYRSNGYNLHYVLIIADGFSDQIIDKLIDQREWGFKILGIVTNSRLIRKKFNDRIAIIPEEENLMPILDTIVIDEIIYSKYKADENEIEKYMKLCNEVGIIFRLQSTVSPIEDENFQLKTLSKSKFLSLVDGPSNNFPVLIKTITDYYFSFFAIILLSPLFLLIALVIKLDSKGPVFFKQERIGLRGRKFKLLKFRTMVTDAEKILNQLKSKNESDGPTFKIKNDPRITRVGRFLRKTGLDELPQLQNVIRGEMSLIGPRPPLESEVKQYKRWQLRRLSVKPGITCSWQVAPNRNDVKFENWMKMDLNYIDNWSLTKDAELLFKTAFAVFNAGGR